ncbi:MAG: sodium-dependent transporter [Planctomycetota bacterium]
MTQKKEQWSSRLGVILAVSGSAVGIGNFLRFPGNVAENGGGAFMIPYFCALIFLAVPLCWAEWAMGKYGGEHGFHSYPAIFGLIGRHPFWRYMGVIALVVPIVVFMYYILIEAWCLGYAWSYLTGAIDLGTDSSQYTTASDAFFKSYVGQEQNGAVLQGISKSVVFWMLVLAFNFWIIYRGVTKGIESFCNVAMPLMTVLGVVVLFRVLTLGTPDPSHPERSILGGLGFMWNPKPMVEGGSSWGALANPKVWLAAAGQIFFTLSIGFGVICNYASYLKKDDDVVLSGMAATATNEVSEVCLGGLITIPAAFVFLGATGLMASLGSTFDLGFRVLPVVFMHMPAGRFFGFIWFFMLFLAAICSSLSMLQPAIAFLEEGLRIGRRASCAILGLVTVPGCLFVIYFSKGLTALGTIDFWVGSLLVFILATLEVILFAWVFGAERGTEYAKQGAQMKLPRVFAFTIRYISPTYLLIVFGLWAYYNLPDEIKGFGESSVKLYSVLIISAVAVFLVMLIQIAGKTWRVEGRDQATAASRTEFGKTGSEV